VIFRSVNDTLNGVYVDGYDEDSVQNKEDKPIHVKLCVDFEVEE
jgi:hypothetical protein